MCRLRPGPGVSPDPGADRAYLPRLARAWARALPAMLRVRLLVRRSRSAADASLATLGLVDLLVLDFLAMVHNLLVPGSRTGRTSFRPVRSGAWPAITYLPVLCTPSCPPTPVYREVVLQVAVLVVERVA